MIVTCVIILATLTYYIFKHRSNKEKQKKDVEYQQKSAVQIGTTDLIHHIEKNKINSKLIGLPIYYVNMDISTDRRKYMENQAKLLNLPMSRISAINGNNKNEIQGYKYGTGISLSELGCTLSHLKAIKTAFDNGNEIALIMEDDASLMLTPLWQTTIENILSSIPNWSIVNLCTCIKEKTNINFQKFNPNKPLWGCGAYIINRRGMQDVLTATKNGMDLMIENGHNQVADFLIYNNIKNAYNYTGKKVLFYTDNEMVASTINVSSQQLESLQNCYAALIQYGIIPVNTIPKHIYQLVRNKNLIIPEIQTNIDRNIKMNPTWEHHLLDDNDINEYLQTFYPELIPIFNRINPQYGAGKADFFRYILMYDKGGVYLDDKSSMLKPLDQIIKKTDQYLLSHWTIKCWAKELDNENGEFQQWHIICRPKHPYLYSVIKYMIHLLENYSVNDGVGMYLLHITGPVMYTRAIMPILDLHHHRITDTETDLGLIYNNTGDDYSHRKLTTKLHYSELTSPIVLPNLISDKANLT